MYRKLTKNSNGRLHWPNRSRYFDFRIAEKYLSHVTSDFDQGCGRLHGLMRASRQGSLAVVAAVRFKSS